MYRVLGFIFLTLMLSSTRLMGQDGCDEKYYQQPISGNLYQPYFNQYRGNPFYMDDWFDGSVRMASGEIYKNVKLRFDCYRGELHYYNANIHRVVLIDKMAFNEFWLERSLGKEPWHVVQLMEDDSVAKPGFYFLLYQAPISLYMKSKKLIDAQTNMYPADGKIGEFYEKNFFYYKQEGNLIKIPLRKRKLAKMFPEYHSEIIRFISKNNLSLKQLDQLVTVFQEINRLADSK